MGAERGSEEEAVREWEPGARFRDEKTSDWQNFPVDLWIPV